MSREEVTLVFRKGDDSLVEHHVSLRRGIMGVRDAQNILKLHKTYGDPVSIIGDGAYATLLRKEYLKYYKDEKNYRGVSCGDLLKMGGELIGIKPRQLKRSLKKVGKKLGV